MTDISHGALRADVAIAGGGIIGLSLALELRLRGLSVVVFERDRAMRAASWAAGGMLAVDDPQNPLALMPLAHLSRQLYPAWLRQIEQLSGLSVPLRTQQTLQHAPPDASSAVLATQAQIAALAPGLRAEGINFHLLEEASVDPRDLCAALPAAFVAAGGVLLEHSEVLSVQSVLDGALMQTSLGPVAAASFVNCCGAWSGLQPIVQSGVQLGAAAPAVPVAPVTPIKGHMANLRCAPGRLLAVVRAPKVYLIPRGDGRVTVGSTLEHAGFDTRVDAAAIARLIATARTLLPELEAPEPSESSTSWAGLRPGTPDGLPILGRACNSSACWLATGHFRDGILLAPATARVMAQAILGEPPAISLDPFRQDRF